MDPEKINMDEDEFMGAARLRPENLSFHGKDMLRKTPAELTEDQIEWLSVASLENDLSPEQSAELEISLKENSGNRAVFNAIQKTRLIAPSVTYKNKSSLKKLTAGQRAFRIAISGLSAAAAIAILIVSYIFIPDRFREKNNPVAFEPIVENVPYTFILEATDPIMRIREKPLAEQSFKPVTADFSSMSAVPDTVPGPVMIEYQTLSAAFIPATPDIKYQVPELSLLNSDITIPPLEYSEERGRLRRFIASTFRDKVLGDENYSDDPIKAFEIARAGVDGLNKLLDWNMELKETVSETGEVKSVYFSSALLTFNSPVRKTSE